MVLINLKIANIIRLEQKEKNQTYVDLKLFIIIGKIKLETNKNPNKIIKKRKLETNSSYKYVFLLLKRPILS